MENLKNYLTVDECFETEETINKSRFISRVYHIETEEEAKRIISDVKKEHYKSTHVCSAYILATNPKQQKASDDGEPSGTAGKPILNVIENLNLKNILVVVIRYYGGIKLGAGGLIRAYSSGASNVLKHSEIIQVEEAATILIQTEYSFYEKLKLDLESLNIFPVKEEFTDIVNLYFYIPKEKIQAFNDLIKDKTNDNFLTETIEIGLIHNKKNKEKIIL